mmetsp:Transcript_3512/g.4724  ORF Transcript_3512/g.4724 Transcript_3512/m.4724 type:complete len:941 (-) Transcript_3512:1634-4456(-)
MSSPAKRNSKGGKSWTNTIERCLPAIVELRVDYVRTFDGQRATNGVGTGFVVDKARGIILTNRHIVTLGPITANAVFTNKKRIPVIPIYRDPIHDFGFFQYDPKEVDYKELTEIKLAPEEAKVGLEFRMIGSGESEQNSIIPGTLARLDREAPRYQDYMDFNTFYFAAVSMAKSGSSGSPILANSGNAIALNCGGSNGAASFFLPLERIVYALECIQSGKKVHRGTILSIFTHKDFDDVRALGLSEENEKRIRNFYPEATGMLVMRELVPGGPAERAGLRPGDALLSIQGKYLHHMLSLQEWLDTTKQTSIKFKVSRGGKELEFAVELEDMDNVTPSEYLELGNAVLNPVGFISALRRNIPVGGVLVSDPGYTFRHAAIPAGAIIVSVDGHKTPNLDEFENIICQYPDKAEVLVQYFLDKNNILSSVVTLDRVWFPMRRAVRNDKTGFWDFADSTKAPSTQALNEIQEGDIDLSSITSDNVVDSLVTVEFRAPYTISGNMFSKTSGVGVIVNIARGLVVVPRRVVFSHLGDVEISISSLLKVPAETVFMHPIYNLAIIQFNPARLIGKGVKVAQARVPVDPKLKPGDACMFLGLTAKEEKLIQKCNVTSKESPYFGKSNPPRYVQTNQEFLVFDQTVSLYSSNGGIFFDNNGKVGAFWFVVDSPQQRGTEPDFRAIPAHIVYDCVKWLEKKVPGKSARDFAKIPVRSLTASLGSVSLGRYRTAIGISDAWVKKFATVDIDQTHQILTIKRVMADSKPAKVLEQGDFVLSIDNNPVVTFEQFENAVHEKDKVTVTVLRNREEKSFEVETEPLMGFSIDRVVFFGGLILHPTFDAVKNLGYIPKEITDGGVYLTGLKAGSPAARGRLNANGWLTKVKNVPTPDLDTFLEEIQKLKNREYVNIELHKLNGASEVLSIQNDFHYFGAAQLVRSKDGHWEYEALM